jgi:hypothetical protein
MTRVLLLVCVLLTARGVAAQTSLLPDVQAERAKITDAHPSPAQLGTMLNAIAWKHRGDGWGLSRKTGGTKCPSIVGDIACDILHHRPSNTLYDVFGAAGAEAIPQWGAVPYHNDPNGRPWVAPAGIDCGGGGGGSTPVDLGPLLRRLDALEARAQALEAAQNELVTAVLELQTHPIDEAAVNTLISMALASLRVTVDVGRTLGHSHKATAVLVR